MVVNMADNTIAIVAGDNFWTLKNEDTSAVYYSGDYTTTEERLAAGADVVYQTEKGNQWHFGMKCHKMKLKEKSIAGY